MYLKMLLKGNHPERENKTLTPVQVVCPAIRPFPRYISPFTVLRFFPSGINKPNASRFSSSAPPTK